MREGWQLRQDGTHVVPLTISLACQAQVSTGAMPVVALVANAISKRANLIKQSTDPAQGISFTLS